MESQDTNNIYNLYREAYDFNYKPGFHDFGPEINEFMKRLSEDEKISLIEGHFRHAFKEGRENLDGVLYDKLKELDDINKLSLEELQAGLDYWHEENAEEKFPGPGGSKSNNLTDLVAHSEHIADDLAEMGYEDNELVSFVQTYIQAAIDTVLDNPEWFRGEENAEERNWRDELNRAADSKARERNASIIAHGGPGDAEESDDGRSYNTSKRPSKRPEKRSTDSGSSKRPGRKNWRDDLERAAERRNSGIIARGGPGWAEPTDGRRY